MDKNKEQQVQEITDRFEALIDMIITEIKLLPDEYHHLGTQFAEQLAFQSALWASYNHYESIGVLQEAMLELREASKNCICEDCNPDSEE